MNSCHVTLTLRKDKYETALLLYTEVHTFTPGVVSLSSPSVDPVLTWNILIVIVFILVTLLRKKKTISATTVTKYLVYFNGNIFSCLHSKYLLCCCWGRWKCAARLWKANWKCYHNVMFRKYTLSIKIWSLPARRQLCFLFVIHIKKAIETHRVVENAELPVKKYTKTGESPSSVDPDSRRHYRAFSQVHLRLNMKYYS